MITTTRTDDSQTIRALWSLCETVAVTERLLTTGQAAKALDVPRSTLNLWISQYGIEPTDKTLGGHMRWDIDDLRGKLAAAQEKLDAARERAAKARREAREQRKRDS